MFSTFLRAPLITLVTYIVISAAPAASLAPSLTVRISTPDVNADGSNGLKVTTVVSNTGNETVKLLNNPHGVLSPFPGDAFAITDPSGSRLLFDGTLVDYNSTYAAGFDRPSAFTVLVPGHSVDVTHDLSAVYDFARSGAGDYSIEPSNVFTYVDADGSLKDLYASVEGIAEVKVSGDRLAAHLPLRGRGKDKDMSVTFDRCSDKEQAILTAAAEVADRLIAETYTYVQDLNDSTVRYTTWYGAHNENRMTLLRWQWRSMTENPKTRLSALAYICDCGGVVPPEGQVAIAWVNPFALRVRICPPFWELDEEEKGVTLVHESSHFLDNGLALDYKYGGDACKQLAKEDPDKAVANADSFAFFAWNKEGLE